MFSWLTGGSNNDKGNDKPSVNETPQPNPTIAALGSDAGTSEVDLSSTGTFDPSILERIVKAAEALKSAPNAGELIQLAQTQEKTWQERFNASRAEAEAKAKEMDSRNIQLMEEEKRVTQQHETEQIARRAQYEDQLAKQRYNEQLQQQQQVNERERQLREQSAMRQEMERRKTVEYEAELKRQTELAKAQVDAEARIKQERENRDIIESQLLLKAEENRKTVLEAIKTAGSTIGQGVEDYLKDTTKVMATVGVFSGIALGIYSARAGTNVASQYIAKRMNTPPLVRETSRKGFSLNPFKGMGSQGNPLEGMVLKGNTEKQLAEITIATANRKAHGANFRHLLLYGPPGTGKTMFARKLAQQSGLEYAILAGGDVGPLGKGAVSEIHRVFDWAETSNKGLLLFIDEADAFLRKRGEKGDGKMSEETRNALSTFLYRTGDPTNKFMLVFSSNEPEAFDRAVTDRVDEVVELALPSKDERKKLLELYFDTYVRQSSGSQPVVVGDDIDSSIFEKLADDLKGFSGRQIAKLCSGWQAAANASSSNILTKDMMQAVVKRQLEALHVKDDWAAKKIN